MSPIQYTTKTFLYLYFLLLLLVSCHSQQVLKTADYVVNQELDKANSILLAFRESHSLNMMANLQWSGMVDDSLYYVALSAAKDTLYALNCYSGYLRVLPLKNLRSKQIIGSHTFYYHNHDSIFFCIRRTVVMMGKKNGRNDRDILLINGKGELLDLYTLDSLPDIYFGERSYGRRYPWDHNIDERLFANGLLVDAATMDPHVTDKGFSAFNPKIVALCNLEDNAIRMLNIRYPAELHEKKYEYSPEMWVKVIGAKELLVGFTVTPYIYRYDLDRDTMVKLDVFYDETFYNTDSAAMTKGEDYPMILFRKPIWSNIHSCYMRNIYFHCYKDYSPSNIVELLDSNLNHISYVYADKKKGWHNIRCHADGTITVADDGGYGRHAVKPTGRLRNTRLPALEQRSMIKKPKANGNRELTLPEYLNKLKFPDSCTVVIINMKYPCGPCLQELSSFYKENNPMIEKEKIYYLFFDAENNKDDAVINILKNYGVQDFKHIRIDHKLLPRVSRVLPNGMKAEYMQYMIAVRNGDKLQFSLPNFQELISELYRITKNK